jgi:hypothetical protein
MFIATLVAGLFTGMPAESAGPIRVASICFSSGEEESGMNKICYYDCLSGTVAITIGGLELCPLTIDHD